MYACLYASDQTWHRLTIGPIGPTKVTGECEKMPKSF